MCSLSRTREKQLIHVARRLSTGTIGGFLNVGVAAPEGESRRQSVPLGDFELVSAIVAHPTSGENVGVGVSDDRRGTHPQHSQPPGGGGAVKHRSPLFTLAAVALAFIIMFTVDVLAGPPGASSAQPAATSAPAAPARATSPSSQAGETAAATPSASASKSTEETKSPQLNPENPQVTVDGEKVAAAPVNGDDEL